MRKRFAAFIAAAVFAVGATGSYSYSEGTDSDSAGAAAESASEKENKSEGKEEKKTDSKEDKKEEKENNENPEISEKRGTLTIIGEKTNPPKRYKVILKKLYTSKKIGSKSFYDDVYNVPEYAQAIEIQGSRPVAFNRENIIEADENGKAVFSGLVLGEYEIREENESADLPFYTVKIPTANSTDEKNFNIEIKNEKLTGGAIEFRTFDGEEPVKDMKYSLYRIVKKDGEEEKEEEKEKDGEEKSEDEKSEEKKNSDKKSSDKSEESEEHEDSDGNTVVKVGKDIITNEYGYISVSDLELGSYYVEMSEPASGYLKDEKKTRFEVDALGSVKMNGGVKIGKVISNDIQVYSVPEIKDSINGKDKTLKTNTEEPFEFRYTISIPNNIEEYDNLYFNNIIDEKLEFKEVKAELDGRPLTIEQDFTEGNKLIVNLNQQEKFKGKEKIDITVKCEVLNSIEDKAPIVNEAYMDYYVADMSKRADADEMTVTPTYGKIKIINQDKKNESMIQGGKFALKKGEETVIEGTTDTRGNIVWDKVPYGEYELVQSAGSDKYDSPYKEAKNMEIVIDDEHTDEKIVVENTKINEGLFRKENLIYIIPIAILIAIIAFFIRRNKKQKRRKRDARIERMRRSV